MGAVRVEILLPGESRKQMAEIPDNAPSQRIISTLVKKMGLSVIDTNGQRISYNLQHKESGKQLSDNETLAEANVHDGDVLRVEPVMTAGRL